ncbi:transmembrane protein [Spinellus fusiger]|nr:transmembrane protein [Spinellus fusiger]
MSSLVAYALESLAERISIETSANPSWYPEIRLHAIELTYISSMAILLFIYSVKQLSNPSGICNMLLKSFIPSQHISTGEKITLSALFISWGVSFIHKWIKSQLLYMLLPCHMSALLLMIVIGYSNKLSVLPNLLFNVYLYTQWGALAALIAPDLNGLDLFGELANFYIEHALVLIAPLYMIYIRRYVILPISLNIFIASYSIYVLYSNPIVQFIALLTDKNINYLIEPPQVKILLDIGPYYRMFIYCIIPINMYIYRSIIVNNFILLLRSSNNNVKKGQ